MLDGVPRLPAAPDGPMTPPYSLERPAVGCPDGRSGSNLRRAEVFRGTGTLPLVGPTGLRGLQPAIRSMASRGQLAVRGGCLVIAVTWGLRVAEVPTVRSDAIAVLRVDKEMRCARGNETSAYVFVAVDARPRLKLRAARTR